MLSASDTAIFRSHVAAVTDVLKDELNVSVSATLHAMVRDFQADTAAWKGASPPYPLLFALHFKICAGRHPLYLPHAPSVHALTAGPAALPNHIGMALRWAPASVGSQQDFWVRLDSAPPCLLSRPPTVGVFIDAKTRGRYVRLNGKETAALAGHYVEPILEMLLVVILSSLSELVDCLNGMPDKTLADLCRAVSSYSECKGANEKSLIRFEKLADVFAKVPSPV